MNPGYLYRRVGASSSMGMSTPVIRQQTLGLGLSAIILPRAVIAVTYAALICCAIDAKRRFAEAMPAMEGSM